MEQVEIKIGGMHCAACVRRVTAALSRVEGAQPEKVEIGSASVRFDSEKTDAAELKESVRKEGFEIQEA